MRALITGGNGFIGSHLSDRLQAAGWQVTVYDKTEDRFRPRQAGVRYLRGDVADQHLLREAVAKTDVIFHLAWTTIHEVSNTDPTFDVASNLIPSVRLLELCVQASVCKVVFVSSGGTVYGLPRVLPVPETHPTQPICSYGITKLAVEKYLGLFYHLRGLSYAVLRPSTPYGERQSPWGRQGAVTTFLWRVARGLPITIWGDGNMVRDFFYVGDLVEACWLAAESDEPTGVFNVGGGMAISLNQLVEAIRQGVGREVTVRHEPSRPFDVPKLILDTTLARQRLGWQPRVSLAEGVARTWAWVQTLDEEGRQGK